MADSNSDMWDKRYSDPEYAYGTEPNQFLVENIGQLPQKGEVLCLAEGEGRNAVYLAQQGFHVTAVDASAPGMEKANRLAKERSVTIHTHVSDLAHFTIEPSSFDGIVSIFCHVPIELRKNLHRSVVQGLKSGGVLILEAYTPQQIALGTGGPPVAELTMNLQDLTQELSGLNILHGKELQRDVIEGKYHTGRGAVVQLVAVKPN